MDADGSVFLVFLDDKEGLHVNGSQRILSLKGPVGEGVLIDSTRGLVSSDAGVAINLSADNPGLEFDATGGLKATAQTVGDGSHTSKGILQVGDGLNVDNGVVSLETAQGLTVDQAGGKNSVRVKLPSAKGGLMFTENNELELRMVEPPSQYSSVPLAHTIEGVGVMFDNTKGLTAHDKQLALAPATPATLGGVRYDDTTIRMRDGSELFAAIGCVSKVQVGDNSYPNIAPRPICANSVGYSDQSGVWFGFYVRAQEISFDQIFLTFIMADGRRFPSGILSILASYLTSKRIIVENNTSVVVLSATPDDSWGTIDLILQNSLTINEGPHWFEVSL